jgi:hypothetical protein
MAMTNCSYWPTVRARVARVRDVASCLNINYNSLSFTFFFRRISTSPPIGWNM